MPKRYEVTRGPAPTPGHCTLTFVLKEPDPTDMCPNLPGSAQVRTELCDPFDDHPGLWDCAEVRRKLPQLP